MKQAIGEGVDTGVEAGDRALRQLHHVQMTAAEPAEVHLRIQPPPEVRQEEDEARVERRSPRFHKALSPDAFRALKADPMAYHFQYMRACDDPAVYDWTRLAFGPDAFSRAGAR